LCSAHALRSFLSARHKNGGAKALMPNGAPIVMLGAERPTASVIYLPMLYALMVVVTPSARERSVQAYPCQRVRSRTSNRPY
jgi:hypothetical protein